jgi:hypothetical protein
MSEYYPDNWVVLKIHREDLDPFYKVLAGWSGGYLDGDRWRMNSGITRIERGELYQLFYGESGSCYVCPLGGYGLSMSTNGVYKQLKEQFGDSVELMPEDTNWKEIQWVSD